MAEGRVVSFLLKSNDMNIIPLILFILGALIWIAKETIEKPIDVAFCVIVIYTLGFCVGLIYFEHGRTKN